MQGYKHEIFIKTTTKSHTMLIFDSFFFCLLESIAKHHRHSSQLLPLAIFSLAISQDRMFPLDIKESLSWSTISAASYRVLRLSRTIIFISDLSQNKEGKEWGKDFQTVNPAAQVKCKYPYFVASTCWKTLTLHLVENVLKQKNGNIQPLNSSGVSAPFSHLTFNK